MENEGKRKSKKYFSVFLIFEKDKLDFGRRKRKIFFTKKKQKNMKIKIGLIGKKEKKEEHEDKNRFVKK